MIEFVPDDCAAQAIQACLRAKQCALQALNIPGFVRRAAVPASLVQGFRATMDDGAVCVLGALEQAFQSAGLPFPDIPDTTSTPDTSPVDDAVASLTEQSDPDNLLGFLSSAMTITLDDDLLPIKITVP
jgi:hypothetical protein